MNKDELHKSLEALQAEIDKLEEGSENKARIMTLIKALEAQVENPEDQTHKQSILQKIPHMVEQFEAEHPSITTTLNRIMMILSDMGI